MLKVLFILFATCLCTPSNLSGDLNSRVSDGLQFLYYFNESQGSTINDYASSFNPSASANLGPLIIDPSSDSSWLTDGVGLNFPAEKGCVNGELSSTNSLTNFYQSLNAGENYIAPQDEYTIELWINYSYSATYTHLLTFGSIDNDGNEHIDNMFTHSYTISDNMMLHQLQLGFLSVTEFGTDLFTDGEIYHVCLRYYYNAAPYMNCMVDGVEKFNDYIGIGNYDLSAQTHYLHIANPYVNLDTENPSKFQGDILLVAGYNRALSNEECITNMNSFIANRRSSAQDVFLELAEGTNIDFTLNILDPDTPFFASSRVKIQIANLNLPQGCVLESGCPGSCTTVSNNDIFDGDSLNLRFTSSKGYGQAFFEYRGEDPQPTDWKTVKINITNINDEPIAGNFSLDAYEAVEFVLELNITDPLDPPGEELMARLIEPVAHATFFDVTDTSVVFNDQELPDRIIKVIPNAGGIGDNQGGDLLYSFVFQIAGYDGELASTGSNIGYIEVDVYNSLTANPQTVNVEEDSDCNQITLTGTDLSPYRSSYQARILTQPTKGVICIQNGNECNWNIVRTQDATDCCYLPNSDENGPDSFTFYYLTGNAHSPPATVTINIGDTNEPVVLECNTEDILTYKNEYYDITANISDNNEGDSGNNYSLEVSFSSINNDTMCTTTVNGLNCLTVSEYGDILNCTGSFTNIRQALTTGLTCITKSQVNETITLTIDDGIDSQQSCEFKVYSTNKPKPPPKGSFFDFIDLTDSKQIAILCCSALGLLVVGISLVACVKRRLNKTVDDDADSDLESNTVTKRRKSKPSRKEDKEERKERRRRKKERKEKKKRRKEKKKLEEEEEEKGEPGEHVRKSSKAARMAEKRKELEERKKKRYAKAEESSSSDDDE